MFAPSRCNLCSEHDPPLMQSPTVKEAVADDQIARERLRVGRERDDPERRQRRIRQLEAAKTLHDHPTKCDASIDGVPPPAVNAVGSTPPSAAGSGWAGNGTSASPRLC